MNSSSDNDLVMLEDGPLVSPARLETSLGWTLKPEGLCRAEVCTLVPDRSAVERDGGIDVLAVAELLDRPAVHDEASGLVAIGAPRQQRRDALHNLRAPDFTLLDLEGTAHSLSDNRSKKRLLVAFSSW